MIKRNLSGNMNGIVFEPVEPFYGGVISTFDIISDFTKQYDTKITYGFNVAGMKIKCEEKFVNKTKEASLIFTGEGKVLDTKLTFYKEVPINTNIYENYDWKVKNGVLYVTLFEKINEKPPIFKHNLPEKGVNGSEN